MPKGKKSIPEKRTTWLDRNEFVYVEYILLSKSHNLIISVYKFSHDVLFLK